MGEHHLEQGLALSESVISHDLITHRIGEFTPCHELLLWRHRQVLIEC
jgi:hypothetical protein